MYLNEIKDSGNRTEFDTGAVRDIQRGKGRCDLLPLDVVSMFYERTATVDSRLTYAIDHLDWFMSDGNIVHLYEALLSFACYHYDSYSTLFLELSIHFEQGAEKYGEKNWQKGIPAECYMNSAIRHLLKYIRGDKDEAHDRAFCWNIVCCIWTCKNMPNLNDYKEDINE